LGSKYDHKFQHGRKDKTGAKLRTLSNAHDADVTAERITFDRNKLAADATDRANKISQETTRDGALATLGLTGTPDATNAVNGVERNINSTLKPEQAAKQAALQPLQDELNVYQEVQNLLEQKENYDAELANLNAQLTAATTPAQQRAINAQIDLVAEDIRKNNTKLVQYRNMYSPVYPVLAGLPGITKATMDAHIATFTAPGTPYANALNDFESITNDIYDQENAIQQFRRATDEINNLNKALSDRQKKFDNWDKDNKNHYLELIAYWDMLETGRDSHTGHMYSWSLGSKKNKQDSFSANASAYISAFATRYGRVT